MDRSCIAIANLILCKQHILKDYGHFAIKLYFTFLYIGTMIDIYIFF